MPPHLGHPFRGPNYLPPGPPPISPVTPVSVSAPPSPVTAPPAGVTVARPRARRRTAFVVGTLALSIAAGGVAGAVTGARDPAVDLQQAAPPAAAAQGSITAAA